MSATALAWARDEAPVEDPLQRLTLLLLADAADDDGYAPFSLARLAEIACVEHLADVGCAWARLREHGLIEDVPDKSAPFARGLVDLQVVRLAPEARLDPSAP